MDSQVTDSQAMDAVFLVLHTLVSIKFVN